MIGFIVITIILLNIMETNRESKRLNSKLNNFLLLTTPFVQPNSDQKNKVLSPKPSQNNELLRGIDVSHWNGNLIEDLPHRDDLKFVICKATQGERDIDPDFRKNRKFLTEKNITKGVYHFYIYPQDPIQQAEHFCNTVGELKASDFPLIIDIEDESLSRKYIDHYKLKNDLLKFLDFIETKTAKIPVIYSNYAFLNKYITEDIFSKYPLWLAEYSHAAKPRIPKVWRNKGCLIWQKTDSYDVNSDEVDFDIYFDE